MIRILLFVIFSLFFVKAHPQKDYEKIIGNIQNGEWESITNISSFDQQVSGDLSSIQANGSWPDINYNDESKNNWNPRNHLNRLKRFAVAYTHSESSFYGDAKLHSAIVKALQYWDNTDPKSKNWWYNEIAFPKTLGVTLIILRAGSKQIPNPLEDSLLSQMDRGNPMIKTGANKLDIATHYIYRGVLKADPSVTDTGVTQAFLPITLSYGDEGIQPDYSFRQHGPQMAIASYGAVFLSGEVNVATILAGTGYALSGTKLEILSRYARETFLKIIRGRYIDYSTLGRGLSRPGASYSSSSIFKKLKVLNPAHTAEYNAAIERLNETQPASYMAPDRHTHFWRSDYTIHNRKEYSFSVRTSSTRVRKTESGNNENLKGYYLADGGSCIRVAGNEYTNIFPVWDWNKIPGTTVPALASFPLRSDWGVLGRSTFTGGVSDSIYGATVYVQNEYNTPAKKAWFFFDEEIVCLGTAISSSTSYQVATSVNQCFWKGDIITSRNGAITSVVTGLHTFNKDIEWILHGNIGYFFPKKDLVKLSAQAQSGTWESINSSKPATTITENVFKLWIDHGIRPSNASYEYIIVPNKTTTAEMQNYNQAKLNIVANNTRMQAVKHEGLDIIQIIFYEAGTYEDNSVKVEVDNPCMVMLQDTDSPKVTMHISDPAQKPVKVNAYFDLPAIRNTRHLECNMPGGVYSGSGTQFIIDENTPLKLNTSTKSYKEDDIMVYPNPASSRLYIECLSEIYKIEIVGMDGKKIGQHANAGNNKFVLDISNYSKGSYLIKIFGNKEIISIRKFLKF